MLIDLHNHTNISSPCSLLTPGELIQTARERGLDAICVTEHLFLEGAEFTLRMGLESGFPVFRGIEARTDFGDMLIYGYYEDIPQVIMREELCRMVHTRGGLIFAAHPFHTRGGMSLNASVRARGMDLEREWDKLDILNQLDGFEILNGQISNQNNARAENLCRRLSLKGIAGSDAHSPEMVGRAATRFAGTISSDEELMEALRGSACTVERL